MVAQVQKEQAAMVPLGMHPARQAGRVTNVSAPKGRAVMCPVGVGEGIHEMERNEAPLPVKPVCV